MILGDFDPVEVEWWVHSTCMTALSATANGSQSFRVFVVVACWHKFRFRLWSGSIWFDREMGWSAEVARTSRCFG
jgi:hypothetical protein